MSIAAVILAIVLIFLLVGPMRSRGMAGPWNLLWLLVLLLFIFAVVGRV